MAPKGPPSSRDLVSFALRCVLCNVAQTLTFPPEQRLAELVCGACERPGGLQLSRRYDEPPDMEGDEYLLARRVRNHAP